MRFGMPPVGFGGVEVYERDDGMKRTFFGWLRRNFLPEWARDQLMRENQMLRRELEHKERDVERLEAYIQGMHAAMRARRIPHRTENIVEKCGRKEGETD